MVLKFHLTAAVQIFIAATEFMLTEMLMLILLNSELVAVMSKNPAMDLLHMA